MLCSQADLSLHAGAMQELLTSDLGKQLASLRTPEVYDDFNDAYKPRMHKLYAHFMQGVCLNIRKTPLPLATMQDQARPMQSLCPVCMGAPHWKCAAISSAALKSRGLPQS